ncbi:MAG TPA: M20/M25/M40 family metallo-hydrolase [Candidatus Acidoferrales bacterium]|jgi:Zn-dependent M28 family amino/carboxypeptidase|nr:M20/M25/M40 family metallo-hydrolase [Candidatus Acidoferrales bacterium]
MSRIGWLGFIQLMVAFLGGFTLPLLAQGRPVTPADQTAGQAWWAHVKVLADDGMQGRLTGSEGYLRAAKYVVSQFDAMGLQPAGVNGYYQPVKFDVTRVIADKSSMTLLVDGRRDPLVLGRDAILGSRGTQPKSVSAPLVFIGYGLHLPEAKYDDFDSPEMPFASLKGKIAVFINGGPGDLPGSLKSFARTAPLAKALADAGAVGSITIPTPKSMDFPWDRVAGNASQPGMRLAADARDAAVAARHPALADLHGTMFSATFNPAEAEKLFAGTGHTFAELLALADAQKPLRRFDLKKSLTASVTSEITSVESPNIVAKLEGSDTSLKNEYVLLSAHLDHLGEGAPVKGKTTFAGAMDDASGVASVLEIARSFSRNRERPKRSMLFVIFTGEEKGLLGSRYFAGRPTVPETGIVADLNLDMFMPLFPLKKLHVQGLAESTLAEDARAVGAGHNIEIAVDPEPDRNSFIRTDQYSFVQAGVPALAMKFGWTADSPEYKAWRQWLARRYHSVEDNLSQPVDTAAAAQFDSFLGDLARRVADNAERPHYVESSFFHRFEK